MGVGIVPQMLLKAARMAKEKGALNLQKGRELLHKIAKGATLSHRVEGLLDQVKLPRSMSLQEFSKAYPSKVDIRTLALINQVSNAGAPLTAGKRLKRVVGR